jgi:capsular exopolysaccharide synthesis family protein
MPETFTLPAVIPTAPATGVPVPGYSIPTPPQEDFTAKAPAVPLSHYLWILRRHAWKIAVFICTCVLATFVISSRLQPIYESTATIDIDRQAPAEVIGEDSKVSAPNDADQFLATQVKVIQSDAVLRPVAEKYDLLRKENQLDNANPDRVQRARRAPVVLKRLKVTRTTNTYLLLIGYRSPDPELAADVANAIANSYLEHTYNLRIRSSASLSTFMEGQLDELKAKMERSSQALAQFERELNVINPDEKTNILSARLLQLNTEYTSAQADRVAREAAYNSMTSGSLEAVQVSAQSQSLALLGQRLNEAQEHFAQVKTTFGDTHPEYRKAASQVAELQRQFDDSRKNIADRIGVEYRQALNREQMLQKAVLETKAESDSLNARSFQYQQLKREADADKTLYDELIRKIREAGINAGFQNNNIRISDVGRPALKQVFPNMKLNLLLAFLFSAMLAVGAAVLGDSMDTTLRDPEMASRYLATDVIGILPAVRNSVQLSAIGPPESETTALTAPVLNGARKHKASANGNGDYRNQGKGYYRTISGFEEAVRTLRNTILLGDFEQRLRSMLITSAGPGEGKTTAAVHLAISHASQGKKTLLVDGDLRRPSVHHKFGLPSDTGFTNVLTGEAPWRDVVIPVPGRPGLFIIPAGPPSHRAADLVGPRIGDLLDEFAKEYDLVILDAPPLLGFAEPLQMATAADGVLVISRAGETRRKAVSGVLAALSRIRANVIGVVLNHVKRDTSDGYGYGYYGYHYRGGYYQRESEG